ncbi:unnamed protein product [Nesidiocoris tenuis]|uniref:Uncharacterized protein n=1 Tax=Nesidiocoris tenuis TaxID=355587 RepID=A0A6H5G9F7_9HEMI|nr:unnamed protein product [Nesidiocoris tenuis]
MLIIPRTEREEVKWGQAEAAEQDPVERVTVKFALFHGSVLPILFGGVKPAEYGPGNTVI